MNQLSRINVKQWEYNGLGGTPDGKHGFGAVADELLNISPECVGIRSVKLHPFDNSPTDIYTVDPSPLVWILVNAVKELDARLRKVGG